MPTAKGDPGAWAALARAKGLTPANGEPWLTLAMVVPVATKGTLNSREHWAARHKRVKGERLAIRSVLQAVEPVCPHGLYAAPRVRVTLTRVNGGTMDGRYLADRSVWPPDGYVPPLTNEEFDRRFPRPDHKHGVGRDAPEPDDGGLFDRVMTAVSQRAAN